MVDLKEAPVRVRKRDGRIVPFDANRISLAAGKALTAAGTSNDRVAANIGKDVVELLINKGYTATSEEIPDIELIQDLVESSFIRRGLSKAAKLYILYRAQREKVRTGKQLMMDVQDLVSSYIDHQDWRVNENSNAGYSYASLLNHVSGAVIANYTLANVYPKEIADAHTNGDFHLHDLSCGIVGYCAGWSLRQLLTEGFRGRGGRASASPARHFDTALGQIVNFLSTLQTEWAGAQAFNSFDTFLAPFVRADKLTYDEIKQNIQSFVFGLNIASRWGQTPFTNLTLDWVVPEDLRDQEVLIGGELIPGTRYADYQPEMDQINRAFLEVMSEGDRDGRIFTFPIPTYNITKDFNWDSENAKLLFQVTGKYGLPYFQNFINSDLNPGDVRSMCCRLQMDVRELRKKTGGLFGAGEQTGSIGVVTINMPRIGYLSKSEDEFFARLDNLMRLAMESLEIKRKVVQRYLDADLLPYTRRLIVEVASHGPRTFGDTLIHISQVDGIIEADRYPACYRLIPALPKLLLHSWLSRLQTERFEQKTDKIMQLLERHRKDWEHVFFIILARNFGFGTNSDAFEFWAETIPLQAVNKHRDSLFQIEAFFFGQAGLLQEVPADEYTDKLMKEYTYLSHKFGLRPSANSRWKLLRMRPDNFPHVRIAQLASFYYRSQGLLSALMEAQSLKSLRDMLRCGTSEYWLTHYVFGEASPPHPKTLSNQTIDLLVINTVIPFLYAYGKYKTDNILIQRANGLLEEMRPENNFIVRIWKECGLEAAHAGDSQALIQLKKNYCDIKKCLYCRIGYEYLKKPQCGGQ